ncbi:hypothetical protein PsYK624_056400 [Phanerochaete sordida]|uniref:Uncharacterized protein n=1 Tax=Phanerochaete sordida TaxID=48140 RepID=A0A9P3G5F2_9APHY|nr:hypothetical protein PsYK624_056400 [Phanerochaete sordida]
MHSTEKRHRPTVNVGIGHLYCTDIGLVHDSCDKNDHRLFIFWANAARSILRCNERLEQGATGLTPIVELTVVAGTRIAVCLRAKPPTSSAAGTTTSWDLGGMVNK